MDKTELMAKFKKAMANKPAQKKQPDPEKVKAFLEKLRARAAKKSAE